MECRDRLAFWLLELELAPIRALSAGEGDSVTVRAGRGGRRFDVTIVRDGHDYRWSLHEVGGSADGTTAALRDEATEALTNPEYAFWEAWGALDQHAA